MISEGKGEKMKNILIVINRVGIGSGAARVATQLGTNLEIRGYNVFYLPYRKEGKMYNFKGNIIYLHEESHSKDKLPFQFTLRLLKIAKSIAKICEEKRIDTIISFLRTKNLTSILSKVIFKKNIKVIASVRNNPKVNPEGGVSKIDKILEQILYTRSDKIIPLSKGVEYLLNTEWGLENTRTIYNPYPLERYKKLGSKPIKDKHKYIFDSDFIFINIGRLHKQKGQWHLLRSFKKVTEKHENSKLVILGEGPLKRNFLKLIKKLQIEKKVILLGNVENVFPYLRNSDCFIFSSLHEGFGNAQIEALSQNLPVISADCVAGPRDILCPELDMGEEVDYPYYGEYGILSKPFDQNMSLESIDEKALTEEEKTLAHAMMKVMENERLRERYSNGVERVKDFEPEKIIDQWEEEI